MSIPSKFVSLHPYFKLHPAKIDAVTAMLPRFVEKTASEKRISSTGSALTAMKFFAVKRTRMPTAYLRISTMSARCWRKC
jgi:hypothetical protein